MQITNEKLNKITDRKDVIRKVEFLCSENGIINENLMDLFVNTIYNENKPIMRCVNELKDYILMFTDRGADITAEVLDTQIEVKNYDLLLKMLEELFLEPIPDERWCMDKLKKAISEGLTGEDIVTWRDKGQNYIRLLKQPSFINLIA